VFIILYFFICFSIFDENGRGERTGKREREREMRMLQKEEEKEIGRHER
jgi:hypothetical protein